MIKRNSSISTRGLSNKLFHRYIRLLLWMHGLSDYRIPYTVLVDRILTLRQNSGTPMCVAYLKLAHMAVMKYLAGTPLVSVSSAPRVALKFGLPLIVPASLRDKIRNDEVHHVKALLATLSIFRLFTYKGDLKLETITSPFSGLTTTLAEYEITRVWRRFSSLVTERPKGRDSLLILKSAGPNNKISVLGAPLDAKAISATDNLLPAFSILSRFFGGELYSGLLEEIEYVKDAVPRKLGQLGKLSLKYEAAGKVRVFAIVDVWTQSFLVTIHEHVFAILRQIPQDGTFDQSAPIAALQAKLLEKIDKTTYSYDLSAATDRFPVDFQCQVLSKLYNKEVAEAWRVLLVDRLYALKHKGDINYYSYAVGQPMGALSSWGVFALSHHVCVQIAAIRAGKGSLWFADYALLGDDIVIADEAVAKSYFSLMTEEFGVGINLSKSLQSTKGVMEFAKQLVSPSRNYTSLGPKNILLTLKAPGNLPTLFSDLIGKGVSIEPELVMEWVNNLTHEIFKISRGKLETLLWMIIGPSGPISSSSRFGPSRVESTLATFQRFGVPFDFIDEVREAFDSVINEIITEEKEKARVKTTETINKLKAYHWYSSFYLEKESFDPPSRRHVLLDAYERFSELFDQETTKYTILVPYGHKTVTEVVKHWLNDAPLILAVDNPLSPKKQQRPRLVWADLEFFIKVNKQLQLQRIQYLAKAKELQDYWKRKSQLIRETAKRNLTPIIEEEEPEEEGWID